MEILDDAQIEKQLKKLHVEWSLINISTLERVFTFKDFTQALNFVNKVAKIADSQNHHPDIHLSWGKVVVHITTHSAGGLTNADFKLAAAIK